MSLRLQLILLTTLVLLLSLVIGGALAYGYARAKVQTEMRAAIAVGQRLARTAIDDAATSPDPDRQLRRIVAEFDGDRHLRASWLDGSGRELASSKLVQAPDAAPEWLYRLLAGKPGLARLPLPPALQDRGSIALETDPHNEIAEAWDDIQLTLATMGIFCGLVLLLTSVSLGYALRPLARLSAAFARVGDGKYGERIAETGPLELARLCQGFNRMLDRLSEIEGENLRLQEQLAAVQDEERADLARDLHDEIGPFLFAVGVDAAMIKQSAESAKPGDIAARADAVREATEHMQKHIRAMLGRLRPGVLINVGLRQAVDNLITSWRARRADISFTAELSVASFREPLDGVIYRIIQESLSNAVRHGRPSQVSIRVRRDGGDIDVNIHDNGKGFDPAEQKPGHGLSGMEERVRAIGGVLKISRRDGGGVAVSARLPEATTVEDPEPAPPRMAMPA